METELSSAVPAAAAGGALLMPQQYRSQFLPLSCCRNAIVTYVARALPLTPEGPGLGKNKSGWIPLGSRDLLGQRGAEQCWSGTMQPQWPGLLLPSGASGVRGLKLDLQAPQVAENWNGISSPFVQANAHGGCDQLGGRGSR